MYYTAIKVITPLVEKIDELEEPIVANVGLLLISLLLATNQLKKAQAFLDVLEIILGLNVNSVDGNISPESPTNIDDFKRMFKLTTLLANVLNRKTVVIPHDNVSIIIFSCTLFLQFNFFFKDS